MEAPGVSSLSWINIRPAPSQNIPSLIQKGVFITPLSLFSFTTPRDIDSKEKTMDSNGRCYAFIIIDTGNQRKDERERKVSAFGVTVAFRDPYLPPSVHWTPPFGSIDKNRAVKVDKSKASLRIYKHKRTVQASTGIPVSWLSCIKKNTDHVQRHS